MILEAAQALVGLALLAWLPGTAWRRVLLPSLDGGAAFLVDVLMSVSLVTLLVLGLHTIAGAPVSAATAVWVALAVTAAAFAPRASRALARMDLTAAR